MVLASLKQGARRGAHCVLFLAVFCVGCSGTGEPGWSNPSRVDSTRFAFAPQLFAGGEGRSLALWRLPEPDGPSTGIAASWHVPGRGWASPTIVDDYRALSIDPSAATDANGNAIVIWAQSAPGTQNGEVWARRYLVDSGWADAELVGVVQLGVRGSPNVAFDRDGGAVATWFRPAEESGFDELVVSRYTVGAGWGPAEGFETTTRFGDARLLATSVDRAGRIVVVWYASTVPWGIRYTDDGWDTPQSFQQSVLLGTPDVQIDDEGRAWAYWAADAEFLTCAGATRYDDDGWEDASVLSTDCRTGSGGAFAIDGRGGAVAVWSNGFGDATTASWSRYTPGAGWADAEPMLLGAGTGPPLLDVTALPNGQAFAIAYRLGAGFQPTGGGADGRLAVWGYTLDMEADQWGAPERLSVDGPYLSVPAPYGSPLLVSYEDDSRALALWLEYAGGPDDLPTGFDNNPWSSTYD